MQSPGGPTEYPTGDFDQGVWVFGIGDDVINPVLSELFDPPYALLLGRRTYDIFAAYWPFVEGEMARMGEQGDVVVLDRHVALDRTLDVQTSFSTSRLRMLVLPAM